MKGLAPDRYEKAAARYLNLRKCKVCGSPHASFIFGRGQRSPGVAYCHRHVERGADGFFRPVSSASQ